jgi:hypothetical protein
MTTTNTTPFEAKLAKVIYNNLTPLVVTASIHPVLSRLNLHNNRFLKKLNIKAKMLYYMSYEPDAVVKASYDRGGDDNIENALIAIRELATEVNHAGHREYIFKRLEFLTNEAINALYDRNHEDWTYRINTAIEQARQRKKVVKPSKKKATTTKSNTVKKPIKKKAKPVQRRRNKKGQFIKSRR